MPVRLLLAAMLSVLAAIPASASAQSGHIGFGADTRERGWVGLRVVAPPGTQAVITADGDPVPLRELELTRRVTRLPRAQPWDCSRRASFTIAYTFPNGATAEQFAEVRTPSCSDRLRLAVATKRARAGTPVALRVRDTWGVGGIEARTCLRALSGTTRCARAALGTGEASTTTRVGARSPGFATASLRTRFGPRVRQTVRIRPRGPLRVLATGDSMIQIVDSFLKARLTGATVTSDAHISTGISKPFMLDWPALAQRQAAARKPDVTVVFLGANDGFPFGDAGCCGRAWVDAYAERVAQMMRTYRRGGRGHVLWMTLPPTSRPSFARVFRAVNAAIRQAAREVGPGIGVIDVGAGVSPGARQSDGVHLSTAGASRAADLVIRALRRAGLLS